MKLDGVNESKVLAVPAPHQEQGNNFVNNEMCLSSAKPAVDSSFAQFTVDDLTCDMNTTLTQSYSDPIDTSATRLDEPIEQSFTVRDQLDSNSIINDLCISSKQNEIEESADTCIVCGISFLDVNDNERKNHLNICLDNLESISYSQISNKEEQFQEEHLKSTQNSWGVRSDDYFCVVCGMNLVKKELLGRCSHLKRCARTHGIGTRELLQMIAPPTRGNWWEIAETDDPETAADDDINAIQSNRCTVGYNEDDILYSSQNLQGGGFEPISESPSSPKTSSPLCTPAGSAQNAFAILMASAKGGRQAVGKGKNEKKISKDRNGEISRKSIHHKLSNDVHIPNEDGLESKGSHASIPNPIKEKEKERLTGGSARNGLGKAKWGKRRLSTEAKEPPPRQPPAFKLVRGAGLSKPVVVDGFQYAHSSLSQCYFLTHFHSDHYGGLNKHFNSGK